MTWPNGVVVQKSSIRKLPNLGSFSNDDGDGNENVTWKCNFA